MPVWWWCCGTFAKRFKIDLDDELKKMGGPDTSLVTLRGQLENLQGKHVEARERARQLQEVERVGCLNPIPPVTSALVSLRRHRAASSGRRSRSLAPQKLARRDRQITDGDSGAGLGIG